MPHPAKLTEERVLETEYLGAAGADAIQPQRFSDRNQTKIWPQSRGVYECGERSDSQTRRISARHTDLADRGRTMLVATVPVPGPLPSL